MQTVTFISLCLVGTLTFGTLLGVILYRKRTCKKACTLSEDERQAMSIELDHNSCCHCHTQGGLQEENPEQFGDTTIDVACTTCGARFRIAYHTFECEEVLSPIPELRASYEAKSRRQALICINGREQSAA